MRKIIIVEGKEDAAFVKALAPTVETKEIEIRELGGAGKDDLKKLPTTLQTLKNDAEFNPIGKIGILLDLDPSDFDLESKLQFVNQALQKVFGVTLTQTDEFQDIIAIDSKIACHFINPNLDVLLRKIAKLPSSKANCLHKCLENDTNIRQKDKDKAWPLYYMRWDVCDTNERKKGSNNVTFTYTNSKGAWDLNAPILNDIKQFLTLFES